MNPNTAARLPLGRRRQYHGHILRATTLRVLNSAALRGTADLVLAGGAVTHAVVEFQLTVVLDRHLQVINGKRRHIPARCLWTVFWLWTSLPRDTLATEGATRQQITLANRVGALKALEVETSIGGEAARGEVLEVEAIVLLRSTVVVTILRTLECREVFPGLKMSV